MWPAIIAGLITAFVVAKDARAEAFVANNDNGGEIVLTDRPCVLKDEKFEGLYEAYTWSPSTSLERGCWAMIDKMVHVIYERKGDRRVYDPTAFRRK